MFNMIEVEGGIRAEYAESGVLAFELRGANSLAIAMIYANLTRQSPQRADDFISGVIAGLVFCQVTQSIPEVTLR